MITNLTALAAVLQTLFLADAQEIARTTRLVKRRRKLTGPVFAHTLTFGWLAQPKATLEQLADGVGRGGQLTHQRYDEIGGVQGALQRQADAALKETCDKVS